MIIINTNQYEAAHGKLPRGTGQWYFIGPADQSLISPCLTFSQAKVWLKKELNGLGKYHTYIFTVGA